MARPYSLDLRERILKNYDDAPIEDIIQQFAVTRWFDEHDSSPYHQRLSCLDIFGRCQCAACRPCKNYDGDSAKHRKFVWRMIHVRAVYKMPNRKSNE